ncbi:hypothetical protein FRB93_010991 [Tulasnella sp. JGI-2019a]|nr:hypothetical protein FRB93_010991 [Tulasnella sp. JGI-2019a]
MPSPISTSSKMLYSLLPSSPDGLPSPATNNNGKHQPSQSFFRFTSTRVSSRRSLTVVVCSLFLIYCYASGRISFFRDVAIVVQRVQDSCADQLPTLVQPGELIRFNGENGELLDNYYVPLRNTFRSGVGIDSSPKWPATESSPTHEASYSCIDNHLAHGATCPSHRGRGSHSHLEQQLDVVWSYVNATDPIHVDAYQDHVDYLRSIPKLKPYIPTAKKGSMREFDELRYSVRSVAANFKRTARKLWVMTSDFPFPGCDDTSGWRVGQVPKWLSQREKNLNETWKDGQTDFQLLHHSDVFEPLANRSIFNSLAIESRLGFIKGLADNFVYMNDDVFFNSELSPRDFYTEEHGPVFRMQSDVMISYYGGASGGLRGEWVSLQYTNNLIGERFGYRARPYLTHVAKALSVPFLTELQQAWSDPTKHWALGATAAHAFRSYVRADPDVSMTLLQTHYVVERWREALLWSFMVGRIGGDNGDWDFDRAWRELGGDDDDENLLVTRGVRDTLGELEAFQANDTSMPKGKTTYQFSSFDGYPYSNLGPHGYRSFPTFTTKTTAQPRIQHPAMMCTLNSYRCFNLPEDIDPGSPAVSASEMFKHVAFRNPDCGDCIISALVTRSGSLGLDAFLPGQNRVFPQSIIKDSKASPEPPRLPLTPQWNATDFSLRSISPPSGMSVREWAVRAIHRYRFVLGGTPVTFAQLESKRNAERTFKKLNGQQNTVNEPAIICINDDVVTGANDVRKLFRQWMQSKWPRAPAWEA